MNEHENNIRATRAAKALRAYESNSQEPISSRVVDLIADLLHFARLYVDEGAESVLRMAKQHFDEEAANND